MLWPWASVHSYQTSFFKVGHRLFNYENQRAFLPKTQSLLLKKNGYQFSPLYKSKYIVQICMWTGLRRVEWQTVLQAKDESSFSECFYTYRLLVWGEKHDCIIFPLAMIQNEYTKSVLSLIIKGKCCATRCHCRMHTAHYLFIFITMDYILCLCVFSILRTGTRQKSSAC